ncbi:MAG: hypothetical protein WD080_01215 [Egibacteraceae bacterium]
MESLERGRSSFDRHVWGDAYAQLSAADGEEPLGPEDLRRLAVAAAVRCAFWLALELFNRGEMARGGGWLARAQRLLDDYGQECVEQGYLLLPLALRTLESGDPVGARETFLRATDLGGRYGEPWPTTPGRTPPTTNTTSKPPPWAM